MLTLSNLSIVREGSVQFAVHGPHHCGPKAMIKEGKIIGLRFTLSPAPHSAGVTARFGKTYD